MIMTRALAATLLVLSLGAAQVSAQQAAQDEAEQPTRETPPAAPAAATPDAVSKTPDTPARGTLQDSPFDYESSEEISKDLSVSFPVDI